MPLQCIDTGYLLSEDIFLYCDANCNEVPCLKFEILYSSSAAGAVQAARLGKTTITVQRTATAAALFYFAKSR